MFFQGNWVDLIILVFVLVYLIEGFRVGFLAQSIELIGFGMAFFGALSLFSYSSHLLEKYFQIPPTFGNAVGFLVVWFLIEFFYFAFVRDLIKKIPAKVFSSNSDKIFSFLPSLVNCFVIFGFILTLLVSLPVPGRIKEAIFDSKIGSPIIGQTRAFEKPFRKVFGGIVEEGLNFLTIKTGSRETIDLKFVQKDLTVDEQSEQKMIELVNKERTFRGLKALKFDANLRQVAREHSKDMFGRGYFSHISPEGEDAGDRLANNNIGYFVAGENLAYAPDVNVAHKGLMESPGHKENILTAEFGKIGIGVLDGGIYGKMFTQVFTD